MTTTKTTTELYMVILSYVDRDHLARSIEFVEKADSAEDLYWRVHERSRDPAWLDQRLNEAGIANAAAVRLGGIDHVTIVPLTEGYVSRPIGRAALPATQVKRIRVRLSEYLARAVIASLQVGGPEDAEGAIQGESDALDADPTANESRGYVSALADALGLSRSEVIDLGPGINWRRFSPELLESINGARQRRDLAPLIVPQDSEIPF